MAQGRTAQQHPAFAVILSEAKDLLCCHGQQTLRFAQDDSTSTQPSPCW